MKVKVVQNSSTVERRFSSWIGGSILASLVSHVLAVCMNCIQHIDSGLWKCSSAVHSYPLPLPPSPRVPSSKCGCLDKIMRKGARTQLRRSAPNSLTVEVFWFIDYLTHRRHSSTHITHATHVRCISLSQISRMIHDLRMLHVCTCHTYYSFFHLRCKDTIYSNQ